MALDKNDIDTYLYQLTERVESLERFKLAQDEFDKEVQELLEITKDFLENQHKWNQTMSEIFNLHDKYIKLLGGKDD